MEWGQTIKEFEGFLKLEKGLSKNSVEAYLADMGKLTGFLELEEIDLGPGQLEQEHLKRFLIWINEQKLSARSQARILSGVKAFYRFLIMDDQIDNDPTALMETPKLGRKLPEVLAREEIDSILDCIDLSTPEGRRNKAMLELLYSCGLRVSELVDMKLSNLHNVWFYLTLWAWSTMLLVVLSIAWAAWLALCERRRLPPRSPRPPRPSSGARARSPTTAATSSCASRSPTSSEPPTSRP